MFDFIVEELAISVLHQIDKCSILVTPFQNPDSTPDDHDYTLI